MISTQQANLIKAMLIPYSPESIGLFGSRIRGEARENSDLDILVSFKDNGKSPYSLFELISIEKKLEEKLGFPTEIVNNSSIKSKFLRESIYKDLIIIYEHDS